MADPGGSSARGLIRPTIPNSERAPAAVFRSGAWARGQVAAAERAAGGAGGALADDGGVDIPPELKDEAQTVLEFAHNKATKTLPVRNNQGKLKWTNEQLEVWGGDFCQPLPNPARMRVRGPPSLVKFKRSRRGTLVWFWDPSTFDEGVVARPRCVSCGGTENIKAHGWPKTQNDGGLLPVLKLGGVDWAYARIYQHVPCPKPREEGCTTTRWNTFHPEFLKQLPEVALAQFPGVRTRNQIVDKNLMALLRSYMVTGTASGFADLLKDVEMESQLDHQLLYALACDAYNQTCVGPFKSKLTPELFAPQGEALMGKHASAKYYMDRYKEVEATDVEARRRHILAQGGEVLRADFTHEESKHIRINFDKQVGGVLTIQNEFNQPVRQWCGHSKSIKDYRDELKAHYVSYESLRHAPPKIIYVDDVEASEKTMLECYPSIRPENGGYGVKECPTHAIRRILQTLAQGHALTQSFLKDISLAMYEIDEHDRQRVISYLREGDAAKKRAPMSEEDIAALPEFRYWHHHPAVKRRLRMAEGPNGMLAEFDGVIQKWLSAKTYVNGKVLFTEGQFGTETMCAKVRALIRGGYLSDPVGFSMHIDVSRKGARLPRYITKRGNSQLEGYHRHLHKVLRDISNAGPELADIKMLSFNYQCCIDGGVRNRHEFDLGTRNLSKVRKLNDLYSKHGGLEPFPDVQPEPNVDGTMGLVRFDSSNDTYQALLSWLAETTPVVAPSIEEPSGNLMLSEDDDEYQAEHDAHEVAVAFVNNGVKDPEDPLSRFDTNASSHHLAPQCMDATTTHDTSPGKNTAASITRAAGKLAAAAASGPINNGASSVLQGKRQRQSDFVAQQRGLPDVEKPVTTVEEKELYMKLRVGYLEGKDDGTSEIPKSKFKQFAHDWNVKHVFPTQKLCEETSQTYIPGPFFLKRADHLVAHEETVKLVQTVMTCKESMPGGVEGQKRWQRQLSKARFPLPFDAPMRCPPLPPNPAPNNSSTLIFNPCGVHASGILMTDAINGHHIELQREHTLLATNSNMSNRSKALTGLQKFCGTCLLHKSKKTGHLHGKPCPYGEKMCESKGGPLLPGKVITSLD